MVGIAPLHGIELPPVEVQPAKDIVLNKLTPSERNRLWEQWGQHASALGVGHPVSERHAVRIRITVPKWLGHQEQRPELDHPYSSVELRLYQLVSAIRLLRKGYVGFTQLELTAERWCPFIGGQRSLGIQSPFVSFHGLRLREQDTAELSSNLAMVADLSKRGDSRLELALSRFNLSLERHQLYDRLIDAIVALEAIFLDQSAELSFRLSLRAAACISTGKANRIRTYQLLRAAYDLRSQVLHGRTPPTDIEVAGARLTPEELQDELRDILRRSLLKAMKQPSRNPEKWFAEIDSEILAGPPGLEPDTPRP
jgi:hypothetical protein